MGDLDPDGEGSGDVSDLTDQDLADALAAAAHRVTVDNSFGGGAPFERVEAIGETGPDGMIDARHDRRTA